jgi:CRP-like cAMP-binding protein
MVLSGTRKPSQQAARHQKHGEVCMLSTAEKVHVLTQVPFFQGMTPEQLEILAESCETQQFEPEATIIAQGAHNESLHIIVSGRVAIEQHKQNRAKDSARVATLEPYCHFGEASLFHNQPHMTEVVALEATTTINLRREVLAQLARQEPELALQLIQVLGRELSEAQTRIAELSRARPRELHRLFDQLDEK